MPWILLPSLTGALVLLWLAVQLSSLGRRPKGYPPGPRTLPIIGNAHQMPKSKVHIQFQKWAEEYGPVFSLIIGSQVVVVLNSNSAVIDLLEKRSAIYSSRPSFHLSKEVASGGLRWPLAEYGDFWRKLRRVTYSALNSTASKTYVPYQELESTQLLFNLLDDPSSFREHLQRFTMSVITQVTFGFRTPTSDHEYTRQVLDNLHATANLTTVAAVLDAFPWLQRLPDTLLPARDRARKQFKQERAFLTGVWSRTKESIEKGNSQDCFANVVYKEGLNDDVSAYACATVQEAASDTTAVALLAFIQAMMTHSEVQKKAQAEVDAAFGDALPSLNEALKLPYVRGCVEETLRWLPVTPLGVPHAVMRDDEYLGYTIPKDATIVMNTWGLYRDPAEYPNPTVFDPTRFDGGAPESDTATAADEPEQHVSRKRAHFAFGAGRRSCPGAVDDLGNEIMPPVEEFLDGAVSQPLPFKVNISCRGPERARRIRESWAECRDLLDDEFQWKNVPGM
ncbi:cytochrome P450 [Xylariomycetidae sp. FL2044]|nr:cytochrome P450 [Xylariomycetidae sp. FL2044]